MRLPIITLLLGALFFPLVGQASPKKAADLLKDSLSLRTKAARESSFEKKVHHFKQFENNMNASIKAFEAASPDEGGDEEEKVVKLSFRFEALLPLTSKKPGTAECEKARQQIELLDKSGKSETTPLSESSKEALHWLEIFCK